MKGTLEQQHGELVANIRRFKQNLSKKSIASQKRVMQVIMERSQELVPYDQGDTHDSAHLEVSPKGMSVSIVYDDWKAPILHEHPSPMSPPSWRDANIHWSKPGTGPKFLQRPFLEASEEIMETLGEDLQVEKVGIS